MAFRFHQPLHQQSPLSTHYLYQQQQQKLQQQTQQLQQKQQKQLQQQKQQQQQQQHQQQKQQKQQQPLPQIYRYNSSAPPIKLFVDDEFKARWDSLYCPFDAAAWMRPHEVRSAPQLFVKGSSRFDVNEGLSDTFHFRGAFLAACAALAERPELLGKVIPKGQVLYGPGYDGSVKFRFWDSGTWKEVQIDDRLPVDAKGKPVYAHCRNDDEFWVPLLEKAFFRLYGNKYSTRVSHKGGFCEGIMRLTGLSVESLQIRPWNAKKDFETIENSLENDALVLLGTGYVDGPGIPYYQLYTVTKAYHVKEEELRLVRVRNPWGNEVEWSGAWRDGDERWDKLSKATLRAMDYRNHKDGEFWIEMKDLSSTFTLAILASEKPRHCEKLNLVEEFKYKRMEEKKEETEEEEEEKNEIQTEDKEDTNKKEKIDSTLRRFLEKPQFLIWTVGTGDIKQETDVFSGDVQVCVELKHIGYSTITIFEVPEVTRKLRPATLRAARPVASVSSSDRETMQHAAGSRCLARLQPGRRYVAMPTCREEEFIVRLYAPHDRVFIRELTD